MVKNDPKVIVKLLRAIAGGTMAKVSGHDVILKTAANMIEQYERDATRRTSRKLDR